ncbi:hypothetical protein [Mongoliibacter ruber]|uniref:Uncharacterized protein n=1 Tax=Mongoliibacter ruber TaxID=1750599 RepID=A0A2T0WNZ0_9BACT|nr:hypothetical protein [Mongoliibacter ruber]PRY88409.1 hypothetical protein CLW00_10460 [Mongoliibacter ruber]
MRYSRKERIIAKYLSAFPGAKQFLKKTYQKLNFILYRPSHTHKSSCAIGAAEDGEKETFFGYYDKSPESQCGTYLLYHSTARNTKMLPSGRESIEVVCQNLGNDEVIYRNITLAYNWQQGARLHWVGPKSFVFNVFETNSGYDAIQVTIDEDGEVTESRLGKPVYESIESGFLSLNFEKLNKLRPDYGYRCHEVERELSLSEEGIYFKNKNAEEWRVLVSLESILKKYPIKTGGDVLSVAQSFQKFNHIMANHQGDKFVFLHRYFLDGRRIDRLFCYNMNSQKITLLNKDEMVSHYCWKNSSELIVYMRDEALCGDNYYLVNADTGEIHTMKDLQDKFGDGHPQSFNEKFMVFDTYPNKSRLKELFSYHFSNGEILKLGEFLETLSYYGETRCDLHPRINLKGDKVYFDSVHSGKRHLWWIDLNQKV